MQAQQTMQVETARVSVARAAMVEELLECARALVAARYSLRTLGARQVSSNAETLRAVECELTDLGRELRKVSAQGGLAPVQGEWCRAMVRSLQEVGF